MSARGGCSDAFRGPAARPVTVYNDGIHIAPAPATHKDVAAR
ncbi:hypothetical protein [Streptomyces sp. NPDC058773]